METTTSASQSEHGNSVQDGVSAGRESEDVCVICLATITERAITVPCNHYAFDFICLVSWLQQRPCCPLCKANVQAVQYDWRSPTDYKHYSVPNLQRDTGASSANHRGPYRPRTSRRPYEQPQPDVAVLRRRHVYRRKLLSLHVGSNPLSGYRGVAPEMIAKSAELQSKARTWIRRELRVFTFLHTDPEERGPSDGAATTSSNAEFLLTYIMAMLKKLDLKASNGHAEELLKDFLGRDNARLFLHELNAWMRSPFCKVVDWDREVQYAEELPQHFDNKGLPLV